MLQNMDGTVLGIEFVKEEKIIIFYTDKAIVVNLLNGQTEKEYSYNGSDLTAYDIKNSQIVMALGDYEKINGTKLVVTDLSLAEKFSIETDRAIDDVQFASQRIFALGQESVEQYTLKGEYVNETAVKTNVKKIIDYNGCVVISGDSLEKVEKESLK